MNVRIHSVEGKGDLQKETLWLDVIADTDIGQYIASDTTYLANGRVSNEVRHIYWFPDKNVKKGDWVALHTNVGANTSGPNDRKTTTHHFYHGLGRTIWNRDHDCAVLFRVAEWVHKKV